MSLLSATLWPTTGLGATTGNGPLYQLDIPQQPLQSSLRDLARITGLQFAHFSDVGANAGKVDAVRGTYSTKQALEQLLRGTGLTYRFVNDRTVAIVRAKAVPTASETVATAHDEPTPAPKTTSEPPKHVGFLSKVLAFLAACGPIASHVACADEPSGAKAPEGVLAEIVVTARKREENLQSVPVAITALSGEALRANAVQSLEDVRFHAPSLQVSPTAFGSAVPGISIRGQRQLEGLITEDPAVGIYFADVVWERPHGANSSMYDLQSIQVLKGPQGTLFGRNTTGGAVLISPAKPSFAGVGGYVDVTFGNYDTHNYSAMLNLPITDSLAVRFAGQVNKHEGYTINAYNGTRKDDGNDQSYRASITIKPTDNLESTFVYQYFRERTSSNGWRLGGVNPNTTQPTTPDDPPFPAIAYYSSVRSGMFNTLAQLQSLDWHTVINDQLKGEDVETHHASNTTTLNLGGVTLKNILGWHQVKSFNAFDFDGSDVVLPTSLPAGNGLPLAPVTVFNSENYLNVHQWSEEFQVLGTALDNHLDWIGGLYYFREQGPDIQNSDLFGRRINDGTGENKSKSIFAQGSLKIPGLEAMSVTLGARQTWDDRSIDQHQRLMKLTDTVYGCRLSETQIISGVPTQVALDPCNRHRTYSDSAPTWTASVQYAFTPDIMTYVSASRGYKSGGLQLRANAGTDVEPATFDPEYVNSFELGVKSTFGEGILPTRINAAVYDQKYKDIQRTVSIQLPGTTQLITTVLNAGEATIKGGEFELTIQPLRPLELSISANIVDASYDTFRQVNSSGTYSDLSQSKFAMIPKNTLAASLKYELPLPSDIGTVSVRGTWYQQSRMEITDINVSKVNTVMYLGEGQVPAYHLADAFVDWNQVMGQPVDLRLYMKNVTDEDYATGGVSIYGSTGFYAYTLGAPRTYGFELRYRFGTEK